MVYLCSSKKQRWSWASTFCYPVWIAVPFLITLRWYISCIESVWRIFTPTVFSLPLTVKTGHIFHALYRCHGLDTNQSKGILSGCKLLCKSAQQPFIKRARGYLAVKYGHYVSRSVTVTSSVRKRHGRAQKYLHDFVFSKTDAKVIVCQFSVN